MWRLVKTIRSFGSKFRSLNANQSTTCDDCSSTTSSITERTVIPTYKFTEDYGSESKGKEDKEKCRSKKTCHNRPPHLCASACSLLEVLGWSTAALFGVHQYVTLRRPRRTVEPEDVKPRSNCNAGCILPKYILPTVALPIPDQSFGLSILPQKRSLKALFQEQPTPNDSYEYSNFLSLHTESSADSPQNDSPIPEVLTEKSDENNAVTAAARELQAVTNMCVATIQNNVGIQLSQKDQPVEALPYFLAGCDLGYSKACFNAAICYETGLGTEKDLTKAKELYEAAVEKGHVSAMYNLGVFYKEGIGNVEKDVDKSLNLFEKAAAAGLKEAQRAVGLHYIQSNEVDKAFPYLTAAAKQKDPEAEYYLGVCYENGWGIDENMAKAADMYSKAAQKGHTDATYNLAVFYELGLGGIPQQPDTALEMYQKVAATGHVEALARIDYLEHRQLIDVRYHDEELLTDSESIRLQSSSSAPELYLSTTPSEKFSGGQLSKSSSTNVLSLANLFSAFSEHESSSKQNAIRLHQDTWNHQSEMAQTHSLEVPWVAV